MFLLGGASRREVTRLNNYRQDISFKELPVSETQDYSVLEILWLLLCSGSS